MGQYASNSGIYVGSGGRIVGQPTDHCCYLQSRYCSNNSLSGFWLKVSSIPASNTIIEGGTCFYFQTSDIAVPCIPAGGLRHADPPTSATGCSDLICSGYCPTQCPTCASSYKLTVAGWPGDLCCAGAQVNGVSVLNVLNPCDWEVAYTNTGCIGGPGGPVEIKLGCTAGNCSPCQGGGPRWQLDFSVWINAVVTDHYIFCKAGASDCPPGTYVFCPGSGANSGASCSMTGVTAVVS